MAAPTINYGTQVYLISCGVPSDSGVVVSSNKGTAYFYREPNDYILWGQSLDFPQYTVNYGNNYYFLECGVASDPGLVLSSNRGTHYYYSTSFNCVGFCAGLSGGGGGPGTLSAGVIIYNGPAVQYNGLLITYNAAG